MKEKLAKLVEKIKENKGTIIKVTAAVVVAAVAAVAVGAVVHQRNLRNGELMDLDLLDDEDLLDDDDDE